MCYTVDFKFCSSHSSEVIFNNFYPVQFNCYFHQQSKEELIQYIFFSCLVLTKPYFRCAVATCLASVLGVESFLYLCSLVLV